MKRRNKKDLRVPSSSAVEPRGKDKGEESQALGGTKPSRKHHKRVAKERGTS